MTSTKQRTLIIALICVGLIIVGFFGIRTVSAFKQFRGHRPPPPFELTGEPETDVELIRDWMTIGFIAHMYRVHPRLLYEALDIRPNGNEEKSLQQLNDEYFPDQPGHVITIVKSTVHANLPPPGPPTAATVVSPPTVVPTVSP